MRGGNLLLFKLRRVFEMMIMMIKSLNRSHGLVYVFVFGLLEDTY